MTVLSDADRAAVAQRFQSETSARRDGPAASKSDLAGMVAALDDAMENFLNVAVPAAVMSQASAAGWGDAHIDRLLLIVGETRRARV